jgi:hypothetical protein
MRLLLQKGALVRSEPKYNSTLYVAATIGHLETMKTLLEIGTHANLQNSYSRPVMPLSNGCYHGTDVVAAFLVARGS